MKIIDFEKKGNLVRFYLGNDNCTDYSGDDWDDRPYECNAETVSPRYIGGHVDYVFPFEDLVLEPADGIFSSDYCKDDMKARRVPCIIVVPKRIHQNYHKTDFSYWVGCEGVKKFYFNDPMAVSGGVIVPMEV